MSPFHPVVTFSPMRLGKAGKNPVLIFSFALPASSRISLLESLIPSSPALYNQAIMLFSTDEEFYKQVHRVCCAIEKIVDVAQSP